MSVRSLVRSVPGDLRVDSVAANFVQQGRSFLEQGRLQEAIRVCRLGLLVDRTSVEGRLVLGAALLGQARYDEVLAEMGAALGLDPDNTAALALKGDALLHKGDVQQSTEVLKKAAEASPRDPSVRRLQAKAASAVQSGLNFGEAFELTLEDLGVGAHSTPAQVDTKSRSAMRVPKPDVAVEENDDSHWLDEFDDGETRVVDKTSSLSSSASESRKQHFVDPHRSDDSVVGLSSVAVGSQMESNRQFSSSGVRDHWMGDSEVPPQKHVNAPSSSNGLDERAVSPPATIGTLFPEIDDDEPILPNPVESPEAQAPVKSARSSGDLSARSSVATGLRHRLPLLRVSRIMAVVLTLAAGVWGGLRIRTAKLDRQIRSAQSSATQLASRDTYLGYRQAVDYYARILDVRRDDEMLAALARAQAALVAEFRSDRGPAVQTLAQIGDETILDAQVAKTYLQIAAGDVETARQSAEKIVVDFPSAAIGHYLLGLTRFQQGDLKGAVVTIGTSLELGSRPFAYVSLARAEAARGRYSEALSALGRATEAVENHPAAIIGHGRLLLQSNDLASKPSELESKLAELAVPVKRDEFANTAWSEVQGAWAALVLAQIKLARNDRAAAKDALSSIASNRSMGWDFSRELLDVLIEIEDFKSAENIAKRVLAESPELTAPRIPYAWVLWRRGQIDDAMSMISGVTELSSSAEALVVRGRIYLSQGDISNAVSDVDQALALNPDDEDATIVRAQIEILRGNARAAARRLRPINQETKSSRIAVAYANALRSSGYIAGARKVLAPFAEKDATFESLIELAKLERSDGRHVEASMYFARATEMDSESTEARLGVALLEIDEGRVDAGREKLERLLESSPTDASILIETARARILTGDMDGATKLIEHPACQAAWLEWRVARERGQIFLNRQKPREAIAELVKARKRRPRDIETRLLIMESNFQSKNLKGAKRALRGIRKKFGESPVYKLALGIHLALLGRPDDAVKALSDTQTRLIEKKSARMQLARVAYWMGRSHEIRKDNAQALEWLKKATNLNQAHASAFFWIGQIYRMAKKPKPVLMAANYEKAVAIDPGKHPLSWFFLGNYYSTRRNKEAAIAAFERYLSLNPDESNENVLEAKRLLAKIR